MYVGPINIGRYVRCFDEEIVKLTKLHVEAWCMQWFLRR